MRLTATIDSTGAVDLDTAGAPSRETYPSVADARRAVMDTAKTLAEQTSKDTQLHIEDPAGSRTILVGPDGTSRQEAVAPPAEAAAAVEPVAQASGETVATVEPAETAAAESVSTVEPVAQAPGETTPAVAAVEEDQGTTAPVAATSTAPNPFLGARPSTAHPVAESAAPGSRRESLPSFVDRPEVDAPAQHGWRGALNSMGLSLAPSAAELSRRQDEAAVSAHWAGPRTIAVLNPKGGAGKTPTVICLAAVFARLSGGGVLAWDNNNSLGSLGWRTFDAGHEACVVDLLGRTEHFMTSDARVGDLSGYVHHQPADRYDVLRSDDRSGDQERHMVTGEEVDRLHAVAAKYYRAIVMDSGNTERGANWQAMIGHADQVVIPVKSVDDAAEGASRVLAALHAGNTHAQDLARNAVVVVLCCEPGHQKTKAKELAEEFAPYVRAVATIPYDRALVEGRVRFSAMTPATRRAWLRAGAAVREGL
ncbi:AAA family ATPase [Kocuria rosea]|uniref:AAA family ATPase n=1 Tax=Kocuria rosea TaxID=1275 RepID=UPI002B245F1C|nr:AAA family ATPase [Kocuria rosea]MEB2529130.1 AAA family ATPase [Kocuria rosea]MEB2619430.1 AAA family ATPase [Kocuria rosea]